jgi:hypothetical protein
MRFTKWTFFLLPLIMMAFFAACDNSNNPATPTDPDVSAPAMLKAYSDDGKVGLTWTLSTSESQSNFGTYEITYNEVGSSSTQIRTVAKGSSSYVVDGLTNGKQYNFIIRSKTTQGKASTDFQNVTWAPAVRNTLDINSQTIDLYETASTQPKSGLVFNGTGNHCEVLSQAGADWKQRGDVYLFSYNSTSLKMNSANLAVNNPGVRSTKFSTVVLPVDDLGASGALTSPPAAATFSDSYITVVDQSVTQSSMYFARIQGSGTNYNTVRFIIVRDGTTGSLVRGTSPNRYIRLQVSLQTDPNNPYAKH